jgi:hypothetical protein
MIYEIVNPIIIGTLKTKFTATDATEAAKKFWKEISKIIVSEIPQTYFSVRDDKGKLYHFKVLEKKSSDNVADFTLSNFEQIDDSSMQKMVELYGKINEKLDAQHGGRPNDDSSSDESSSVDDAIEQYKRINKLRKHVPIVYYHFIPDVYKTTSIFIPSFIYPYMPSYVEMGFSTAFWS